MRIVLSIIGIGIVIAWHTNTFAGPSSSAPSAIELPSTALDYHDAVGDHPSSLALARAIDARLTLRQDRQGRPIHIWHCREVEGGCRTRIAAMSRLITESSNAIGVDPFLTAGMAICESGLNPQAVSPVGAMGVIQLHPRYRGKTVPFVYNRRYREECSRKPGACQREVLDAGLDLLQWAVKHCDDNVSKGLGWYNSGRCVNNGYARAVLKERRRLLRIAKRSPVATDTVFIN